MTESPLITWCGRGTPDLAPDTPVRPVYRGKADPSKGIRVSIAPAIRLGWSHDGGPDDITGYRVVGSP
jgi:hypothetical protein